MVFGCISEVEGNMVWEEGQRRGKVKCGRRLPGQVGREVGVLTDCLTEGGYIKNGVRVFIIKRVLGGLVWSGV